MPPILESVINEIVNPLILLLVAIATAYFLWGLATFVVNAEESAERAEGKRRIVWGLVGLFVMLSVFGLIRIVLDSFGVAAPVGI